MVPPHGEPKTGLAEVKYQKKLNDSSWKLENFRIGGYQVDKILFKKRRC